MKNVLLVRDENSCNIPYLLYCFYYLKHRFLLNYTEIEVREYLDVDHSGFDAVIYATYPEPRDTRKFRPDLLAKTDDKFLSFKGLKLLFDSHDNGFLDAFERFKDLKLPRIKTAPCKNIIDSQNVIFATTYPLGNKPRSFVHSYLGPWRTFPKSVTKNIDISCRMNVGNDSYISGIRKQVLSIVNEYASLHPESEVDTNFVPADKNYRQHLTQTLISVCPPGHGPGTFRHIESMLAGALMLSHDSLADIQFLPNGELVDGEDYVSFNLDNLSMVLDRLLSQRDQVERMAAQSPQRVLSGYSVKKAAQRFYRVLREL